MLRPDQLAYLSLLIEMLPPYIHGCASILHISCEAAAARDGIADSKFDSVEVTEFIVKAAITMVEINSPHSNNAT